MTEWDSIVIGDADNQEPGKERCHFRQLIGELCKRGIVKNGTIGALTILHDDWCRSVGDPLADCDCNVVAVTLTGREFEWSRLRAQN